MKIVIIGFVFLFWMIFTLILTFSIIGIFTVLLREDHNCEHFKGEEGEAVWFRIGKKLVNKLIE